MKTLLNRPGVVLVVTGILAYLVRPVVGAVPLLGGVLSIIFLLLAIFMVVGGVWMLIIGRGS
ncbi:MAG: hypothetical protein GY745_13865 [Actinomycetia bacterium]|nr:hypothetical protein [Actinomycetes bacterium]MCP3910311.1 hypothetical protein [Actinomycetes bacterium]MCP4086123.1 hypothetical protein [Actinomycetes bacterium]